MFDVLQLPIISVLKPKNSWSDKEAELINNNLYL